MLLPPPAAGRAAPSGGSGRRRTSLLVARAGLREPALLGAALVAPALAAPWSSLALLACGLLWMLWRPRPPRREAALALLLVVAAAAALAGSTFASFESGLSDRQWVASRAADYRRLWDGLSAAAAGAAAALRQQPGSPVAALDPLASSVAQPRSAGLFAGFAGGPAGAAAAAQSAGGGGIAGIGGSGASAAATAAATRAAFDRLIRLAPPVRDRRRELLLVDDDGNPVAWAGDGLIHEPEQWPRSGLSYRAGFHSVTLYAAEPLDESNRPWRVVAGESFETSRLPRPAGGGGAWGRQALAPAGVLDGVQAGLDRLADWLAPRRPLRWSLVDNPSQTHAAAIEVRAPGLPALEVERLPAAAPGGGNAGAGSGAAADAAAAAPTWPARVLWAAVAAALLALAVMRGVGVALPAAATRSGQLEQRSWVPALVLGGVFALGMLAAVPPLPLLCLEAGGALALAGLLAPRSRARRDGAGGVWVAVRGAAAVAALVAAAWGVQIVLGPSDAAEALMVPARDWCIRLAWSGATLGLLLLAGRRDGGEPAPRPDRWVALAAGLLLAGVAASGVAWAALPLLLAGGAAAARYGDRQRRARGGVLAVMAVLAVLASAAIWETAYRARLATYDVGELLGRLAPPPAADHAALAGELHDYFAQVDVNRLVARSPVGVDRRDLAYTLWRASPLARPNALSSLVVRSAGALVSSFAFGLPLDGEGAIDRTRLAALQLPGWEPVAGEVPLQLADGRPATATYWLLPRPGFRVADRRRLMHIETGLLRGSGATPGPVEELAAPGLFALYSAPDGRAALSPWADRPPLPGRLRRARPASAEVDTPAGRAMAYVRLQPGGRAWAVIFLPDEGPLAALERTANWGVGLLLLLAGASVPAALLALPRAAFRDLLRRSVRSYSRRLLIVYTLLLLLPLVLVNALLVRSVELDMLNRQVVSGQAALHSAEQLLGEEIGNLPVGYVFDPGTFDARLDGISEVVRRAVNLYGGSRLAASSEHELFTSGLLPTRLPGTAYASLALGERTLYSLTNHAAEVDYLEIYAPLRLPGDDPNGEPRLFVSVPLLAQQEENSLQLAHLRRHAILVTSALFVLLAAVGTRLAQNFTRPITQLVAGTRRIAAGATSLDLAPTELELAALVAAVDDMARRIALARDGLLREKQVVERVVENITAGVVSLDRERRVLMHNRVAAELLGVAVGESLERLVRRSERLAPVAAFLRGAGGEMARTTVRLGGTGSGEREWSLVWVPLPGQGEPFALLVVEDATEELRGQRLLAWAEMARMIAHEIKNPLTPIRLSTEHMREVHQRDPEKFGAVFERCTANILTQVEELRSIASEFSAYSAIPRIDPRPGDLAAAVAELVEGYRAAPPPGVEVTIETPHGAVPARFDAKLLLRAVRNLIENALRASAGGGSVVVRVEHAAEGRQARIVVLDCGPGVPAGQLARIFDPYFSTHATGTGLGLPIARRIAEEHGGDITAQNRPTGGLEVVLTLPAEAAAAPPPPSGAFGS